MAGEIPDHEGDFEREEIRDLLAPHAARDVPEEDLGRYPLYTMFPFLSTASYRYYMPRFIEYCVKNPNSTLGEFLLYSLADDHERSRSFCPGERAVVREYLKYLAAKPGAELDAENISAALEKWK